MTQFLPPNLLALFAPRDPIPYLPPTDKLPHEKKLTHNYIGLAAFVAGNFENPKETPLPRKVETREERLERKKREKDEQIAYKLEQEIALWDPNSNEEASTDPFKTLYIGRINYYTSESKIRREFESYGEIKQIKMITDKETGKPKGYCFIEYEHERDMHSAYKHADGKKIDGRRVLVDVERARTVNGWLPRRLGGGLGGTRRGGPDVNIRHSGREDREGRGDRDDRSNSRRRSRSRDRDRSRERRRRRSRSKDRKRTRRSKSRSRDRDREKKRSRSRDRKRRRSRSPRAERRRDRGDRDRARGENGGTPWEMEVKAEPKEEVDYDEYGYQGIKVEPEDRKPTGLVDNGGYVEDEY